MNIYDQDLKLDHDKAAAEVRAQAGVNPTVAAHTLRIIQTAALLDIGDSLRTLAIEAAISMSRNGDLDTFPDTAEDTPAEPDISLSLIHI